MHTYDYCGNMVYFDEELSYILTPAGRAVYDEQQRSWSNEYFLKDHLGNIRVVYGDPDRDHVAEVIQEDHYYPFGMTMGDLTYTSGLANRYLYQGKETTSDFNLWWQDFHARRFDSQLGRWHVPDPVTQYLSPYIGMGNNPVLLTDANGTWAVGGPWYWSRALKEAEQVVADFRKQLMESYSSVDWEREIDQMELWNDIINGKYKDEGTAGQPESTEANDDPPGGKNNTEGDGNESAKKENSITFDGKVTIGVQAGSNFGSLGGEYGLFANLYSVTLIGYNSDANEWIYPTSQDGFSQMNQSISGGVIFGGEIYQTFDGSFEGHGSRNAELEITGTFTGEKSNRIGLSVSYNSDGTTSYYLSIPVRIGLILGFEGNIKVHFTLP